MPVRATNPAIEESSSGSVPLSGTRSGPSRSGPDEPQHVAPSARSRADRGSRVRLGERAGARKDHLEQAVAVLLGRRARCRRRRAPGSPESDGRASGAPAPRDVRSSRIRKSDVTARTRSSADAASGREKEARADQNGSTAPDHSPMQQDGDPVRSLAEVRRRRRRELPGERRIREDQADLVGREPTGSRRKGRIWRPLSRQPARATPPPAGRGRAPGESRRSRREARRHSIAGSQSDADGRRRLQPSRSWSSSPTVSDERTVRAGSPPCSTASAAGAPAARPRGPVSPSAKRM